MLTVSSADRSSESHSDSLLPPPPSPYPAFTDPSPVDSNGTASTETTEIEDDDNPDDDAQDGTHQSPLVGFGSPVSPAALVRFLGLAAIWVPLTDFTTAWAGHFPCRAYQGRL